jgi:hypothetical protein
MFAIQENIFHSLGLNIVEMRGNHAWIKKNEKGERSKKTNKGED